MDGTHLPTFCELLRGCPLYLNDIEADASRFAEQAIAMLDVDDASTHALLLALTSLRIAPAHSDYVAAARQFEARARWRGGFALEDDGGRCHLYAALSGGRDSVLSVAAHAVRLAYSPARPNDDTADRVQAAVAWLLAATGKLVLPKLWTQPSAAAFIAAKGSPSDMAERMARRMLASRRTLLKEQWPDHCDDRSMRQIFPVGDGFLYPYGGGTS
jgi:hypothetical protein